jgi:hypothetical protein
MIYTTTITAASLHLRESRVIADLLMQGISDTAWNEAIFKMNVLQMDSPESIRIVARLLRARIEPFGRGLWQMVRDGDREQATQAAFAGAIKDSRLLGDFMDITLREQRALFTKKLEHHVWTGYIEGCRGRDPEMPHWSDSTVARLRSSVFSMLAEAGYLESTRSLLLQNVFVDAKLAQLLDDLGESYVLRCLQVAE